ncbi:hypothetical protein [Cellulomonas sp. NS3]|uniref:hypothetical protein n=1 Tax=Cellulomonas sp. NS3 TaxID=2973977 RepID=UPI002163269E|nr:hypothetical protein [Cellulomonas sp. NS3]
MRTSRSPGAADRHTALTVWLSGTAFHVRDETGRRATDVLADVTGPRGLGAVPRSVEVLMDDESRARRGPVGTTDLYGDWERGEGRVQEVGGERWSANVRTLAVVAEQLLVAERERRLVSQAVVEVLGRRCAELHDTVEGVEDGRPFRSEVRLLVAEPFVLLREVRDAGIPALAARSEVVELDEGPQRGADLHP